MELGADMIKTQYTGTPETFELVAKAAYPIPVLIAGGVPVEVPQLLTTTEDAIRAGAAGVSFGRNIFSKPDPRALIAALKAIVLEGQSALSITETGSTTQS